MQTENDEFPVSQSQILASQIAHLSQIDRSTQVEDGDLPSLPPPPPSPSPAPAPPPPPPAPPPPNPPEYLDTLGLIAVLAAGWAALRVLQG